MAMPRFPALWAQRRETGQEAGDRGVSLPG